MARKSKPMPLTVERALRLVGLSGLRLSPDGTQAAFVQSLLRPEEKTRATSVWAVTVPGGELRRLTHGPEDGQPCWSPEGATLAFVRRAEPGKPPQIMLLPLAGGEAEALGEPELAPASLSFTPDGKRLGFLAAAADDRATRERKQRGDDARVFLDEDRPTRLWTISRKSGRVRAASPADVTIWEYSWLPSGKQAVVVYSQQPGADAQIFHTRLGLLDLHRRTVAPLAESLRYVSGASVSPDGHCAALIGSATGAYFGRTAWALDLLSGEQTCLTPELAGSVEAFDWLPDSSGLIVQVGEGLLTPLYRVLLAAPGELQSVCRDRPPSLDGLAVARGGAWAALICQGPGLAPEVYCWDLQAPAAEPLTHVNAAADRLCWGRSETVSWTSGEGRQIEGRLTYPPNYRPGQPSPLILVIHGGPMGRFRSDLGALPHQLLAAEGYLVLAPNPRGSTGYGAEFLGANYADWGGGDYRDLMAGVDYLVERGLADPDRLGVYGGSYGGYLTAWTVSQTRRFRAAICQCGLTDLCSFNGTADIPSFLELYFGVNPYDDAEPVRARSPLTFLPQVTTPVLFLHGEADARVPPTQTLQMHWGLRHRGVETQLVTYPREGHGIAETPHQRDLYRRIVEWFAKYLG